MEQSMMNDSGSGIGIPVPKNEFPIANFDESAEEIWNKYFERLLRFATNQMRGMPKVASDEEDITLSVLKSVCLSIRDGRIKREQERDGLWTLLVVICKRKIANQHAYQRRAKRNVAKSQSIDNDANLLHDLRSNEIRPEMLVEFNERLEELFSQLEKDVLKKVALAKIQGFTNEEIAGNLGCSLSTVERKLRVIRGIWSHENGQA